MVVENSANVRRAQSMLCADDTRAITVLRCEQGRMLAKTIRGDGSIIPYDQAKYFDAVEVGVADLDHLTHHLAFLSHRPRCCIVRGALVDGPRATRIRRLLHVDRETGDRATLRDVPRPWAMFDFDDLVDHQDVPTGRLVACGEIAIRALPAEFYGCQFVVQASASHFFKAGLRLHLWCWLSRPTYGHELRRWLAGTPVDPAVFGAAQIIYTAAPVFGDGAHDPLLARQVVIPGLPFVQVPPPETLALPLLPERAFPIPTPARDDSAGRRYAEAALRRAVERVATAAEGSRNIQLNAETFSLSRFVVEGLLDRAAIANSMAIAARHAGLPAAEAERTIRSALGGKSS
jgi:hypothetical protein